eukprot:COSAG02_NODE_1264_length_13544_cov_71.926441_1_plen_49_part_00
MKKAGSLGVSEGENTGDRSSSPSREALGGAGRVVAVVVVKGSGSLRAY